MTTAGTLTTRVRYRADLAGQNVITDAEIRDYLSAEATSLLPLVAALDGPERYTSSETITVATTGVGVVAGGPGTVSQVYWKPTTGDAVPLEPTSDRVTVRQQEWSPDRPPRYWVGYSSTGSQWVIQFDLAPTAAQSVVLFGQPATIVFASAAAVNPIGHDDLVEVGAAIRCLQKEERSTVELERERARLIEVWRSSPGPSQGTPQTVTRTRRCGVL